MSPEEAVYLIRRKWADHGMCASCGWHAALYEYEPLLTDTVEADSFDINESARRIELMCLSDDDERATHRGVRIPFDERPADSASGPSS